MRGIQSLNPDISAIVDASGGLQSAPPGYVSGDDPVLPQNAAGRALGFTVQEVEITLSAVVDPYLKGEVYLTGLPASVLLPRVVKGTAALTFTLSEFARVRVSAYAEHTGSYAANARFGAPGADLPAPGTDTLGLLSQLEISFGARGAHAF